MAKITYTNKVALNENPSIADTNKVNASDMNEIKNVVNGLDDAITTNSTAITTLVGSVLYNNDNGSNSTITLSDSVANYEYIEIYYKNNNGDYNFVRAYQPNNKSVTLQNGVMANNSTNTRIWLTVTGVTVSGNTITPTNLRAGQVELKTNTNVSLTRDNHAYITRVIGYKEVSL